MVRAKCFDRGLMAAVLVCASLICGCGGPKEKTPNASEQATISGTVTLDGTKSVAPDTRVEFYNTEKAATALGKVDALGNFSLRATDKSVGIPAGRYQVMIQPPATEAAPASMTSDDYKKMMMQGGAAAPPKSDSEIPIKLHSQTTSKAFLEITPGQNKLSLDISKLAAP